MTKQLGSKLFQVNEHVTISCRSESTRYGFRHLATLLVDGYERAQAKECYYNRTWERFEYQSVIRSLACKVGGDLHQTILDFTENYQEDMSFLHTVALAAECMAAITTDTQPDSNNQKLRMLQAGLPGLDVPDDWDTLTEDEKQHRLDAVITELKGA